MFSSWFCVRGARRRTQSTSPRQPRRRLTLEALEERQVPAIFTVNTVGDAPDANLLDNVADTDPHTPGLQTSLRAAIQQANATPNTLPGPDVIRFNIPGVGPQTIQPRTALPIVTEAVLIDGYSQPGAVPNTLSISDGTNARLMIELNGGLLNDGSSGLVLEGRGSTVKGLALNGFAFPDLGEPGSQRYIPVGGIVLLGQGGHTVAGNFIGTDVSGNKASPNNFHGVYVASSDNVIGGGAREARNLISGNQGFGIHVTARDAPGSALHVPAEHNAILGNLIGTNRQGTKPIANTGAGVVLSVFARHNSIGGLGAEERNVISGNGGPYVPFGDPDAPYQDAPDAPYALSGGHGSGIHVESLTLLTLTGHSVPNAIIGNYVGTNAKGTAALPNKFRGITLVFTNETTVTDNVISGNGETGLVAAGLGLTPVHFHIEDNLIGTDASGTNALGNGLDGIQLAQATSNKVLNNTIANNGGTGVLVTNEYNPKTGLTYVSAGNTISHNSIHDNALLGIDLVEQVDAIRHFGPTANDYLDVDHGPNGLMNYPVLVSATAGSSTVVKGWIFGPQFTTFRVEFFSSKAPDPSGYGEGERYLGSIVIMTNGWGFAGFSVSGLGPTAVGEWITATATDQFGGNTSEFSKAVQVTSQSGGVVFPHVELPETKPPFFVPPCDPLALVDYSAMDESVQQKAPTDTNGLDAVLTLLARTRKETGLWGVDFHEELSDELARVLV